MHRFHLSGSDARKVKIVTPPTAEDVIEVQDPYPALRRSGPRRQITMVVSLAKYPYSPGPRNAESRPSSERQIHVFSRQDVGQVEPDGLSRGPVLPRFRGI
jgi:hypothetical protein